VLLLPLAMSMKAIGRDRGAAAIAMSASKEAKFMLQLLQPLLRPPCP